MLKELRRQIWTVTGSTKIVWNDFEHSRFFANGPKGEIQEVFRNPAGPAILLSVERESDSSALKIALRWCAHNRNVSWQTVNTVCSAIVQHEYCLIRDRQSEPRS